MGGIPFFQSFEQYKFMCDKIFEATKRVDVDALSKLYGEFGLR